MDVMNVPPLSTSTTTEATTNPHNGPALAGTTSPAILAYVTTPCKAEKENRQPNVNLDLGFDAGLSDQVVYRCRITPVSKCVESDLIQLTRASPQAAKASPSVAQAQNTAIRHPFPANSARWLASRLTVASNFGSQNSTLLEGVVANRQPSCLCQKQPSTKRATFQRRRTTSGLPGRSRR